MPSTITGSAPAVAARHRVHRVARRGLLVRLDALVEQDLVRQRLVEDLVGLRDALGLDTAALRLRRGRAGGFLGPLGGLLLLDLAVDLLLELLRGPYVPQVHRRDVDAARGQPLLDQLADLGVDLLAGGRVALLAGVAGEDVADDLPAVRVHQPLLDGRLVAGEPVQLDGLRRCDRPLHGHLGVHHAPPCAERTSTTSLSERFRSTARREAGDVRERRDDVHTGPHRRADLAEGHRHSDLVRTDDVQAAQQAGEDAREQRADGAEPEPGPVGGPGHHVQHHCGDEQQNAQDEHRDPHSSDNAGKGSVKHPVSPGTCRFRAGKAACPLPDPHLPPPGRRVRSGRGPRGTPVAPAPTARPPATATGPRRRTPGPRPPAGS